MQPATPSRLIARGLALATLSVAAAASPPQSSQPAQGTPRIQEQDARLDHLVDPLGYRTAPPGELGAVRRGGHGKQAVLCLPGLGFGGAVFDEFVARHAEEFTVHAITLPGFGGTPAPPSPAAGTSFGAQTWTQAALDALERLLDEEHLERPIVIGHWLGGTQLALRLAARRPREVRAVVLLAGVAAMTSDDPRRAAQIATLERRVAVVDQYMAPKWYRTVTRETWDDNNFLPGDYAVDPVRGLRLWREAARPELHAWIRYLCEFNAQDVTLELPTPPVPTLLVRPGFEGLPIDPANDYMNRFCRASWARWEDGRAGFQVRSIAAARAFPWIDQPEAVDRVLREFLAPLLAAPGSPPEDGAQRKGAG